MHMHRTPVKLFGFTITHIQFSLRKYDIEGLIYLLHIRHYFKCIESLLLAYAFSSLEYKSTEAKCK
jgi:hypothetical protein